MAIIAISHFKGNFQPGLTIARQGAPIQKKHGATSIQVGTCFSGPDAGEIYAVVTFPDWATFGRYQQAVAADAEYQRLMAEVLKVVELTDRSVIVVEEL